MRFLHTGDWHIGRTLRGRSRMPEFEAVLAEVVAIAADEKVDAVLVAGDLYDQRAVTPEADALVLDVLLRFRDQDITVVALPGNHDSAARLEAFAPLLERIGVHVVCRMRPPEAGGVVEIAAAGGDDRLVVSCLPFVPARRFSDAAQLFADVATGYIDYDDGMGKLLRAYEAGFDSRSVNVVMGHMFVAGAKPGGGERQITIGADYAVAASRLPATANYVALGHIHKPQKIPGAAAPARYCGSLLQLDFGERDQSKSVAIVDATPGRRAVVREVPLTAGRRLCDVTGTFDDLPRLATDMGDAYLRVTVEVDRPVPGIADRVRELLPDALDIRLDYDREEAWKPDLSLRTMEPRDQFVSYYRHSHGTEPSTGLLSAFDRVYDEVTA